MLFGYTIIYVENVPKTVAFYEKAFGLKCRFAHETGQYAEMETGATALAFVDEAMISETLSFKENRGKEKPAGVEIGLVTKDVKKQFQHAVDAGATPVLEPTKKPWGQIVSYVRDNNGCLVEICSPIS